MSVKSNRTQVGGQRMATLLRNCHTSLPPRISAYFRVFLRPRIFRVSFHLSSKLKHIIPGRDFTHANFSRNITETNAVETI